MTKARDLANIISGGFTADDIPNLDAAKITSGTFADARLSASSVTQHASSHIDWQSSIKTSDFTAVAGQGYFVNTTSGQVTVTLPASPSLGDLVAIADYAGTFDTNQCSLNRNGSKIESAAQNLQINKERQVTVLTYIDATQGWISTGGANEGTDALSPLTYAVEYLVIAGGGAGGGGHRSGGGGAGGYRNSYASETSGRNSSTETPWQVLPGTAITVTVGAGGAVSSAANGGTGGTSSISASGQTTITSNGGGGGGEYQADADAGTYGSGGGAGQNSNANQTGSDGTSGQGFDGGDTAGGASQQQGGAGGGASENGAGGGTTSPSSGGAGLSSSITGSAIVRAGGGGGGSYGNGGKSNGGSGGGGNGGDNESSNTSGQADGHGYYYPTSGTDNTGGGGGGTAGPSNSTTYGRGGSGVVILRVPTANYSGTTSGSPTVSQSGSDTVIVFNSSGSYTT